MPTFQFHTLGCKVNQYETEAMEELLLQRGYEAAAADAPADVYVINTCTVTHVSDAKSRQQIRRMKRANPDAVVAVVGCYAQVAPEAIAAMEGVDIILGTKGRASLPDLIDEARRTGQVQQAVTDLEENTRFDALDISTEQSMTRATIKIQEGCDMFCTYCIIPYARGHIASRPLESVLQEARRLAEADFKEIVLTGIHVASYGKDRQSAEPGGKRLDLVDVVEAVAEVPGIERIRLSSVEPRWITPEKLARLAATGKFCPHFHLSLQSGSDEVLRQMNRKYDTKVYAQKAEEIRAVFPDAGMTTDVIVGFPGETDKHFEETLDFVQKIGFSRMHIFPYSQREGTPAALFTDQVDPSVKKARAAKLGELEEELRFAFMDRYIGRTLEVLLEGKAAEGEIEGYSKNYLRVAVPHAGLRSNEVVEVQITGRRGDVLLGEVVTSAEQATK